MPYPGSFSHEYARTKAMGEKAVLEANGKDLLTCAVAPHQVKTRRFFCATFADLGS